MCVPAHFKKDRVPVLQDVIKEIGFGTLVTFGSDGMEASHLPIS